MIPYGRQTIEDDDLQAVVDVLKSDWLTTGPKINEFEEAVAEFVGIKHAVAVSNGTAGLHAALYAAGISEGDEVITTPMTFAATSNAAVYVGAIPVFADVLKDSLLIDPASVEEKITPKTKAIIAVDYAGQACDYDALRKISDKHNLILIADACHSLGGKYKEKMCGTQADMSVFSFHPVKQITTGEGGMIVTDNADYAMKMKTFRNHGITTDHRQRAELGSWMYEMVELGYNYRITDIQCALGISQLKKLPGWVKRRQQIAKTYDEAFAEIDGVNPLFCADENSHGYHLYVIRVDNRQQVFTKLRAADIGVNVHYIPVHFHPYYKKTFGCGAGLCPVAEGEYEKIISLPMFPLLTDNEQQTVINEVFKAIK